MISKTQRYREILGAPARPGIGIFGHELIKHEAVDPACVQHLRRACEELGTSTRADLLPTSNVRNLRSRGTKLSHCRQTLSLKSLETSWARRPSSLSHAAILRSASIGQVHAAPLSDAREVVVKVRKPQVDELVRIDLEILSGLTPAHTSLVVWVIRPGMLPNSVLNFETHRPRID